MSSFVRSLNVSQVKPQLGTAWLSSDSLQLVKTKSLRSPVANKLSQSLPTRPTFAISADFCVDEVLQVICKIFYPHFGDNVETDFVRKRVSHAAGNLHSPSAFLGKYNQMEWRMKLSGILNSFATVLEGKN